MNEDIPGEESRLVYFSRIPKEEKRFNRESSGPHGYAPDLTLFVSGVPYLPATKFLDYSPVLLPPEEKHQCAIKSVFNNLGWVTTPHELFSAVPLFRIEMAKLFVGGLFVYSMKNTDPVILRMLRIDTPLKLHKWHLDDLVGPLGQYSKEVTTLSKERIWNCLKVAAQRKLASPPPFVLTVRRTSVETIAEKRTAFELICKLFKGE